MMDVLSQTLHPQQRHLYLDSQGERSDHLTPIFPPTNFELPDISFSNSVIENSNFNQSILSSNQIYGRSCDHYMTSNLTIPDLIGVQTRGTDSHQQSDSDSDVLGQRLTVNKHNGGTHVSPSSTPDCSSSDVLGQRLTVNKHNGGTHVSPSSTPDSSSSDDSENMSTIQFNKRALTCGSKHSTSVNHPTTSVSAHPVDTLSVEDSSSPTGASKKGKPCKRKKRKDPNEPQKPVSAYALFFRDSQAAIKGHNPSASFGEVSKIVASLWDQLVPEHKDLYKKRTETAKKQYLKQLAAYRATQVSQSATEEARKVPSPPGLGNMPGFQALGPRHSPEGPQGPLIMPGQMVDQHRQHQSPTHMAQISAQFLHYQHQTHSQQQLLQQISLAHAPPSSPSHQLHCQQHQQLSPLSNPYTGPHVGQTGPNRFPSTMIADSALCLLDPVRSINGPYPRCVRSGCGNHLSGNPDWESKYCSSECIISHCRSIFTNWDASRPTPNTFPVK